MIDFFSFGNGLVIQRSDQYIYILMEWIWERKLFQYWERKNFGFFFGEVDGKYRVIKFDISLELLKMNDVNMF